jgi:glycosyltransferase involved in cell wall biosynthesis
MISLSVIAPCRNQRDRIRALLDSLEQQSLEKDAFEVILSDDGSTDGSAELIRGYRGPLNLRGVFSPGQKGRAHARNLAIKAAAGRFVLFLDGDMVADKDLLAAHRAGLEAAPDCVLIGRVEPAGENRKSTFCWYRVSRGAAKIGPGGKIPPRYFVTNNASLPLELIRKAGLFNEDYCSWGGEDLEMGYALEKCGACFRYLPPALSYHDHPESLREYLEKMTSYAGDGLRRLIRNCPAHASQGYIRCFMSGSPFSRAALGLFFSGPVLALAAALAPLVRWRRAAFRLYDYITYCHVFRGLKGFSV